MDPIKKRMLVLGTAYAAAAQVAVLSEAASQRHRVTEGGLNKVIENRGQAMPKGALRAVQGSRTDRRASTKAAAQELVGMSNQTLVVAHLHPRWLRASVEKLMDMGATVTHADVDKLRAFGPGDAEASALAVILG